jgi:hypothetical protein
MLWIRNRYIKRGVAGVIAKLGQTQPRIPRGTLSIAAPCVYLEDWGKALCINVVDRMRTR